VTKGALAALRTHYRGSGNAITEISSTQDFSTRPISVNADKRPIDWFKKNPEGLLRFNIVHKAIGMDTQNFRKNVRRHLDFKEALANHDIAEARCLVTAGAVS
jgi:hypothetical protein